MVLGITRVGLDRYGVAWCGWILAKIGRHQRARRGLQTCVTCWKSPEMNELDLVLSQDTRESAWDRVVFDLDSLDDGRFSGIFGKFRSKIKQNLSFWFMLQY